MQPSSQNNRMLAVALGVSFAVHALALAADVRAQLRSEGLSENHWLTGQLNNARLLPMSLYDSQVPAFLALYADCGSDLGCLYEEAGKIAKLDRQERDTRLAALAARYEDPGKG